MKKLILLSIILFSSSFAEYLPYCKECNTKENRIIYAKKLKTYVDNVLLNLPSLSPKNKEWIENELNKYQKSKNYTILLKLEKNLNYDIYKGNGYLEDMSSILELIINSNKVGIEIHNWARLYRYLTSSFSYNEWQHIYTLHNEKLIPEKYFSDKYGMSTYYSFYANNTVFQAEYIFDKIIMNYIEVKR